MNPEQVLNLIDQAERAMTYCRYTLAENLIRQLHNAARDRGDHELQAKLAGALNACRRRHILDVIRILKQNDPLQSQRKEQS